MGSNDSTRSPGIPPRSTLPPTPIPDDDAPVALSILLLVVAPYAVAATAYLEARRRQEAPPRWARFVAGGTVLLHLAGLVLLGQETGRSPFRTESQALSFLAFALAGVYALLEATSRIASHGGGFQALAAILAGAAVPGLATEGCAFAPAPPDRWMAFHVGFALLGTAALLAGGLLGIGYLGVYRRMKRDGLAMPREEGPSLAGLERLSRDASLAAIVLLSPSLALGIRIAGREGPIGSWTLVELVLAGVQLALAFVAFLIWWRAPRRGALAARLNVLVTILAVVGFAFVHPLLAKAGD